MTNSSLPPSLIPRLAASVFLSLVVFAVVWADPADPVRFWDGPRLPASTVVKVLAFGLVLVAGAAACVKLLREDWPFLIVPLAMIIVCGHANALIAVLLQGTAGLALGIPLWRRVCGPGTQDDTSLSGVIVAWYVGASVNAYFAWIALHWRVNYDFVYFGFLAAEILLFRRPLTEVLTTVARKAMSYRLSPGQWAIVIAATILLPCALVPMYLYDDATRHLFFPKQVAMFGKHVFDPSYIWAVDTEVFAQSYFSISYLLGGEYAVRLSNFTAAFVAMLLIEAFCRRRFGVTSALWTTLIVVSMPLLGMSVSVVYLETLNLLSVAVLTVVAFQMFHSIDRWRVVCFFVLAAFAYLFKQQAVFVAVPLTIGLATLLMIRGIQQKSFQPMIWLALGCTAGCIVVLPFLAQNYVLTGNPFFPWLNGVFRSEWFMPANYEGFRFDQKLDFGSLWALTFHGERFAEAGRFQFGISFFALACFIPLIFVGKKDLLTKWMIAGLFLASVLLWWIITSPNLRYFVGPLVPGAILFGMAMNTLWERVRVDRLAKILTGAALAVMLMANVACLLIGTEDRRPYPLFEAFSKRHNPNTSHIGVLEDIKKVFSIAAARYGKESSCLLAGSVFLCFADQHVVSLDNPCCYRNVQAFLQCKNEEEAFDWIFRKQHCACIIMTKGAPFPLLTSARFREMVQVDFSIGDHVLLVPKADSLDLKQANASGALRGSSVKKVR